MVMRRRKRKVERCQGQRKRGEKIGEEYGGREDRNETMHRERKGGD